MQWLRKINTYFILKKAKKKSIPVNRKRQFLNYDKINTCLLICKIDNDDEFKKISQLAKILTADSKEVTICCYIKNKKTTLKSDKNNIIITLKELSIFGKPSSKVIHRLKEIEFDAVMDITQKSYIPLLYTLINTNAYLFCGTSSNKYCNFLIDISESSNINEQFILEQFLFYLKKI